MFLIMIRGSSTFLGDIVKSTEDGGSLRDAAAVAAGSAIGNVVPQAVKRRQEEAVVDKRRKTQTREI